MLLSRCKGCKTCYSGFRCPNCGRPIALVVCLTVLVPMIAGLSILAWVIPDEVVPRMTTAESGNTRYVFQSIQKAILWPAGAGLLVFLFVLQAIIFKTKSLPAKPRAARSRIAHFMSVGGRGLSYILVSCFFILLGFLFFDVILLTPLTRFREAELSGSSLVCRTLFRAQEISLGDVVATRVEQKNVNRKGTEYLESWISIEGRSESFRSVKISLRLVNPDLARFKKMMSDFVADINNRKQATQSIPATPNGASDG